MTEPNSCPTTDQLRQLLDGSSADSEQPLLLSHVDSCDSCQKRLEALVAGSESWDEAIAHLRRVPESVSEPGLEEAVRRMKADDSATPVPLEEGRVLDFLEPSDSPGSLGRLGPYEVSEVVGKGGMGVVFKAFDPALHRIVAIKVLAPYLAGNSQARKRFIREAQAIAAVSHDHVITIHAIDESAEQPKIVMQYISGRSLQEKLDAEGSLDVKEVLRIGMQTASGLAAAHAQGLVHRDVKPSNILLENGIQRVRLTDFGLARAVDDASLTQSGVIAGTPQYMAPEQANGDAVDHRADLFSLGSVLYAMCVGHSPFRASTTMGVLKRVCHDNPRPIQELNPDIPHWLCEIIAKLLSKDPAARFQTARQVTEILEKWLAYVQQPMVAPRPNPLARPEPESIPASTAADSTSEQSTESDVIRSSIIFQPISGRMFLFALLAGIATAMGFGATQHVPLGELLLVSFLGGLLISFWLLLFIALVRFLWSNIAPVVHWARGTRPAPPSSAPIKLSWKSVPPESSALLAGIVALMLGANIVIATIIAFVAWRIVIFWTMRSPTSSRMMTSNGKASAEAEELPPEDETAIPNPVPARRGAEAGGGFFGLEPMERDRLILAIGWTLSGGMDLAWSYSLLKELGRGASFLAFVLAAVFGLASFAVASCLYVGQNRDQIRVASFAGLFPLSLGAFLRIPMSVITLLWLHRRDVQDSFSPLAWSQSNLGRLLDPQYLRLRSWLALAGWIGAWTLLWIPLVAICLLGFAIPYGPSQYKLNDYSAQHVRNRTNALMFDMHGFGFGSGMGNRPSQQTYALTRLTLSSPKSHQKLSLFLSSPVTLEQSGLELVPGDLENFFREISGRPHAQEAANLFQTIQHIRREQLSVAPKTLESLTSAQRVRDRSAYPYDLNGSVLPEFVAYKDLLSLLDPSVFEVGRAIRGDVVYYLGPSDWFLFLTITGALVAWGAGVVGVLVWRRRKTARTRPVAVEFADVVLEPAISGASLGS